MVWHFSECIENKEYDIYAPNYAGTATTNMFVNGTYVEGRHKANHNINVDGFYTNVKTDSGKAEPQVIDVTDNGTYTFTLYDNVGNSKILTENINNIDKIINKIPTRTIQIEEIICVFCVFIFFHLFTQN